MPLGLQFANPSLGTFYKLETTAHINPFQVYPKMNLPYNIFCYRKSIESVQEPPELYDLGSSPTLIFQV
jgi:hypothetical protein